MSKGSARRDNFKNFANSSYWDKDLPIEDRFKKYLGEDGVKFFTDIYEEHGALNVCLHEGTIPHSVHFREGMQIRNWMRKQKEFKEEQQTEAEGTEQFDDIWEDFVLKSLDLKPKNEKK